MIVIYIGIGHGQLEEWIDVGKLLHQVNVVAVGINLKGEVPFVEYAFLRLAILVDVNIIMYEMRVADIAVGCESRYEI